MATRKPIAIYSIGSVFHLPTSSTRVCAPTSGFESIGCHGSCHCCSFQPPSNDAQTITAAVFILIFVQVYCSAVRCLSPYNLPGVRGKVNLASSRLRPLPVLGGISRPGSVRRKLMSSPVYARDPPSRNTSATSPCFRLFQRSPLLCLPSSHRFSSSYA